MTFSPGDWNDPLWPDLEGLAQAYIKTNLAPQARLLTFRDSEAVSDLIRDFMLYMQGTWVTYPSTVRAAEAHDREPGLLRTFAVVQMHRRLPVMLREALGTSEYQQRVQAATAREEAEPGVVSLEVKQANGTTKHQACALAGECKVYSMETGELLHTEPVRGRQYERVTDDTLQGMSWDNRGRLGSKNAGLDIIGFSSDGSPATALEEETRMDPGYSPNEPFTASPEEQVIEQDLKDRARQAIEQLNPAEMDDWGTDFFNGFSTRAAAAKHKPPVSNVTIGRKRRAGVEKMLDVAPLEGIDE